MTLLLPVSAAILLGMAFSQQPVINAALVRIVGSPVAAATISVFVTLVCLLALLPFSGGTLRPSVVVTLPWWSLVGGFIGVGLVAGGAALSPMTGAALFFVCMVAGQLLGASIADHFGAFGLPVRPFSIMRFIGLAMVMAGAWFVYKG